MLVDFKFIIKNAIITYLDFKSCYVVWRDTKMVLCMEHCSSMIYVSSNINGIGNKDNKNDCPHFGFKKYHGDLCMFFN